MEARTPNTSKTKETEMTATSSYPKISNTSSKSQEKAALEAFMGSLGDQTYLHSLISPKLVAWFFSRVDSDINTDFFEQTAYTENELRREIDKYRNELHDADKTINSQLEQMAAWQQDFEQERGRWLESRDNWKGLYEAEVRTAHGLLEQRNAEAEQVALLLGKVEELQSQVVNLKAKLYDLLVK